MIGSTPHLRAGIIAAGRGERLRPGGHAFKPLVEIAGRTLVDRVLTSLAEAGATDVTIIVNDASTAVCDHVSRRRWPFALRWIVETTPSSMHSFLRIVEALDAQIVDGQGEPRGPFLISTVDTVAVPGTFATFAEASRALDADVVLAVTPVTDDDKPLLVERDATSARIVAIGEAAADSPWATAGFYSVRPTILREAAPAKAAGLTALRAFFGRLHERGYTLAALPVDGGIDVDRPLDVAAAERYLKRVGA